MFEMRSVTNLNSGFYKNTNNNRMDKYDTNRKPKEEEKGQTVESKMRYGKKKRGRRKK